MANSSGICNSFKSEILMGYHQLGAATLTSRTSLTSPTTDTIKAALYMASATTGPSNTAYTATGEAPTAGGYSAGGISVTNANPPTTQTSTGTWTPSASLVYTNTTTSGNCDCVMIYNSTQGNKAIEVITFTAQNPVAATLTLTMPAGGAATSLIMIN
jgi:hypothetical protein